MINMPTPVTAEGNILIHAREGLQIPIFFQQEDGTPRDMTGATVAFEVEGGVRIVLGAGGSTDELVLTVGQGVVPAGKHDFVLLDESYNPPVALWKGSFIVEAFG